MSGNSQDARRRALEPVGERLVRRAGQEAEALLAAARREGARRIRDARGRAAAILGEAEEQGRALGEAETAAADAAARRLARSLELTARREVYQAVRDAVARRFDALRDAPDYPRLRAALEHRARALLGPGARVEQDPRGGVVATAPGRRVDLSLPALAERAADALDEEASLLWTR